VRSLPASLVLIALPFFLAACDGSDNNGISADAAADSVTPDVAAAEVVAAKQAAASEDISPEIAVKVNAAAVKDDVSTDRFIVKYKAASPEGRQTSAVRSKLSRLRAAFPATANHLRRMGIGADVVTTERKLNARDAKAFMRALASDPNVEYVEPDVEMSINAVPNDPEYWRQWGLQSNAGNPAGSAGIRAEGAWDIARGRGAVIGIVDTGPTNHADFSANLLPGYQFVGITRQAGGLDEGYPGGQCAIRWHGTHVSGLAAAVLDNGVGIAGVAPEAKILPVKVLTPCGNGAMSDVADGITWAAGGSLPNVPVNPHPATVINLSLGQRNGCSQTMQSVVDYATSRGAIVVAAAGNDMVDVSRVQPANCHNVISVGGSSGNGGIYVDSNFGKGIDIAAPAVEIWSTLNSGTSTPVADSYAYMSGTSMAAPMVSGAIALAQSVSPNPLSVAEYRALLQQNVQPFMVPFKYELGQGILDAEKTVKAAQSDAIPVAADFLCTQPPNILQITCKDLSTARGGVPIKSWRWAFNHGGEDMVRDFSVTAVDNVEYAGTYDVSLTVTDANGKTSSYDRAFDVVLPTVTTLTADVPYNFSEPRGQNYFKVHLPPGVKSVTAKVDFADASQGAFLYLKDSPTPVNPTCESNGLGTTSCTVNNPPAGDYYATLANTSAKYAGTITMTYE